MRHNRTPKWFKKRPLGEQIFLLAADLWQMEEEGKPRSSAGVSASSEGHVNTMTLQQFARLR